MMYTNMDSFINKRMELDIFLSSLEYKPNIIAITEVNSKRFVDDITESELSIEGYDMFSVHLSEKNFRGVVIYVDKRLVANQVEIETKFNEFIAVKIRGGASEILVCNIYRSPNSSVANDKELCELCTHISVRSLLLAILISLI